MAGLPPLGEASPEDVKRALADGVAVVDIRREEEWIGTGVIEGAQTVTAFMADGAEEPGFRERFSALVPDPGTPVMLYCRSGARTGALGAALIGQHGLTKVSHLTGGILRWLEEGNAVVDHFD